MTRLGYMTYCRGVAPGKYIDHGMHGSRHKRNAAALAEKIAPNIRAALSTMQQKKESVLLQAVAGKTAVHYKFGKSHYETRRHRCRHLYSFKKISCWGRPTCLFG